SRTRVGDAVQSASLSTARHADSERWRHVSACLACLLKRNARAAQDVAPERSTSRRSAGLVAGKTTQFAHRWVEAAMSRRGSRTTRSRWSQLQRPLGHLALSVAISTLFALTAPARADAQGCCFANCMDGSSACAFLLQTVTQCQNACTGPDPLCAG